MITDNGLRLATNEVVPNSGTALTGGAIGSGSATLALDASGLTQTLRNFNDIGGGQRLAMAFNVVTAYTTDTFGGTIEIRLISMPIAATVLDSVTGGYRLRKSLAVLTDADDTVTIANHAIPLGTPVHISSVVTTTGLASQIYYAIPVDANKFRLATSLANALAGTYVVMGGGDGTCTVIFIPTVHGSTGTLPMYDIGTPSNQGPLRAGTRYVVPLRNIITQPFGNRLAAAQTLKTTVPAGPISGLIGANAQRFYYLHYNWSNDMLSGAMTCDIVIDSGDGVQYSPTGMEVVG